MQSFIVAGISVPLECVISVACAVFLNFDIISSRRQLVALAIGIKLNGFLIVTVTVYTGSGVGFSCLIE